MRRDRSEAGLTLVEMLIAVALLGIVLLGIAPLFIASIKSNSSGNEYTSVNMLARDRLEQLMDLPFNDPQLDVGFHANDQPARLPDPITGIPTATSPASPYRITYQVLQYQIPDGAAIPTNAAFTPTRISAANQIYQYKRIDVTATAHQSSTFGSEAVNVFAAGFGARVVRLSGCLSNPTPASLPGGGCGIPGVICSQADPCPIAGQCQ